MNWCLLVSTTKHLIFSFDMYLDVIFSPIESIESFKEKTSKVSPRLQVVTELLQTEKNYVGILQTVINVSLLKYKLGLDCSRPCKKVRCTLNKLGKYNYLSGKNLFNASWNLQKYAQMYNLMDICLAQKGSFEIF